MRSAVVFLFAGIAWGQQQYEVGADIGYGFYRNGSIYSAAGTAQAGIRNRFLRRGFFWATISRSTFRRSSTIYTTTVIRFFRHQA